MSFVTFERRTIMLFSRRIHQDSAAVSPAGAGTGTCSDLYTPNGSAVDSLMTVTATDELTDCTYGMRDK